jgi:hypothetical protein
MNSEDELKEDTIKFPMDVMYSIYRICLIEWMILYNFNHFGNLDISVMYSMEGGSAASSIQEKVSVRYRSMMLTSSFSFSFFFFPFSPSSVASQQNLQDFTFEAKNNAPHKSSQTRITTHNCPEFFQFQRFGILSDDIGRAFLTTLNPPTTILWYHYDPLSPKLSFHGVPFRSTD